MRERSGRSTWTLDIYAGTAAILALAWIVLFLLFHAFPAIDIAFSSMFCAGSGADGAKCSVFPVRDHWLTGVFRFVFYWAPVAALVVMAGDIALHCARHGWTDNDRMRGEILAIAAYLIGPILIVNGWLKAYSGRPRPVDVSIFGGDVSFLAVGDFGGACAANCSFVSGEAAAAGWLLCLLPLLRGRFRCLIAALMIDISIAAPFLRVAMGAHFLSDALLGWLIGAASLPLLIALLSVLPKGKSVTLDRVR
jgi:membrane-associated phospholipid phosphatase